MRNWIKWWVTGQLIIAASVPCIYGQPVPDKPVDVVEAWDSIGVINSDENADYNSAVTTVADTYPEWELKNKMPLISDTIEALRKKKEFEYMNNLDSLLRQLKPVEENKAPAKPVKQSTSLIPPKLVAYLLWLLAIAAVLFILYQLFAGQGRLFAPGNKKKSTDTPADPAQAEAVVYSPIQLALKAAQAGDYRLAVRYQYLHLLQAMADKKLIELLPQRTNQHYLRAITNPDCKKAFATVLLQYEYVWFGNLNITEAQYRSIEASYRNFTTQWLNG
jgi:hypothetical protein